MAASERCWGPGRKAPAAQSLSPWGPGGLGPRDSPGRSVSILGGRRRRREPGSGLGCLPANTRSTHSEAPNLQLPGPSLGLPGAERQLCEAGQRSELPAGSLTLWKQ